MIEIEVALEILRKNFPETMEENMPLAAASGRTLSQDIPSPVDHPVFDQTAVDGYAILHEDYLAAQANPQAKIEVVGEVAAGIAPTLALRSGQAARIFTGAGIPAGATAVVMQEYVQRDGAYLRITDPALKPGGNIRRKGEQIRAGQTALKKGEQLNATSIGFLASLGIQEVPVGKLPRISIMVTGNEFASKPEEILQGKIFESNGIMLRAALQKEGIEAHYAIQKDDLTEMTAEVGHLAHQHDLLLITGGVSVGDYDFTRESLEKNGFTILFHKVAQKPGKPILFARKGNTFAFGLPGNPRSVMVGYHEYVRPFIQAFAGVSNPFPRWTTMIAQAPFRRKPGRAAFLAAQYDGSGVQILEGQGSHMLQSLARANCIAFLDKEQGQIEAGDKIKVHFFPA